MQVGVSVLKKYKMVNSVDPDESILSAQMSVLVYRVERVDFTILPFLQT